MKKSILLFLAFLLAVAAACMAVPGLRAKEVSVNAPYHHTAEGFRNPPGSPTRLQDRAAWRGFFWRRMVQDWSPVVVPAGFVLPEEQALAGFAATAGQDSITWLGHAAFLLRLDGKVIATDLWLAERASPVSFAGPKRFVPPGISVGKLPLLDVLLISHNHYEHLDKPTLRALPSKDRIQVIVPLGLGAFLRDLGFTQVRELDWGESAEAAGLHVTALPATHFSRRGLFDGNQTLWAGFAVRSSRQNVYFSGDTAYGPVFRDQVAAYGPFDLGLIGIGAYAPEELMRASHATPEQAVKIAQDIGVRTIIGMHWGTVRLTEEPPFEPSVRFEAAARAAGYNGNNALTMKIGETRSLAVWSR